jgi:hypothetical protein
LRETDNKFKGVRDIKPIDQEQGVMKSNQSKRSWKRTGIKHAKVGLEMPT